MADLRFFDGRLSGPSTLYITRTMLWGGGTMAGKGTTVISPAAVGQIGSKRHRAPIYPGRRPPAYGPVEEQTLSRFQHLAASEPRVPCGEKSPPGLVMCARADTPDAKKLAALWKHFRALLAAARTDPTARDRLQDLLTPEACLQRARDQRVVRGVGPNCLGVIDRLIASFDPLRWDKQIGQFLIQGRVAFGGASPLGAMRFAKVGSQWVITSLGAARG
ncbi:MAG TPA: Nif11-like leader peptide family natural product precursor [Thermoleophilaceae bacterium]